LRRYGRARGRGSVNQMTPADDVVATVASGGRPRLGKDRLSELRRSRRPDRADAQDHRRGKALDLRRPFPACAELLHAAAGTGSAAACTYIGWLMHGVRGGILAGLLFVLPGFAVMLVLSGLYAYLSGNGLAAGLFFGLKAAVLASSSKRCCVLGRRALRAACIIMSLPPPSWRCSCSTCRSPSSSSSPVHRLCRPPVRQRSNAAHRKCRPGAHISSR
jgi:hypothetical protein